MMHFASACFASGGDGAHLGGLHSTLLKLLYLQTSQGLELSLFAQTAPIKSTAEDR
jgi:hypothetical protein